MRCILVPIAASVAVAFGAFERIPQSPMAVASAFSYFTGDQPSLRFLNHPADLTGAERIGFTMFHTSPFRLTSLNQFGTAVVLPVRFGQFGLAFTTLGGETYRETTVSVATGRKIGDHMDIGILFNGYELSIRNYGRHRTLGVTASVNYTLSESIRWSLLYRNLNGPRIGTSAELLPQVISTGLTISPATAVTSSVELERDLAFETRYKFGILWRPMNALSLATGFVNHPAQLTAGIAFRLTAKSLGSFGRISYALATHPVLAVSQVVALQLFLP